MRKDTAPYQLNFHPPGVEVHCLYGANVNTVERFDKSNTTRYKKITFSPFFCRLYYKPGTWLSDYPTLVYGDGDGTVNRRSLEGCLHWQNLQKQKVHSLLLPKVDHMAILHDKNVLKYITDLVNNP